MKGYEMDVMVLFDETCGFPNVIFNINLKYHNKKVYLLLLHPQLSRATIFAVVEALNGDRKRSCLFWSLLTRCIT